MSEKAIMSESERFYDVRHKLLLWISRSKVKKDTFVNESGQTRYALKGETIDGRVLTKFVDKEHWDTFHS